MCHMEPRVGSADLLALRQLRRTSYGGHTVGAHGRVETSAWWTCREGRRSRKIWLQFMGRPCMRSRVAETGKACMAAMEAAQRWHT